MVYIVYNILIYFFLLLYSDNEKRTNKKNMNINKKCTIARLIKHCPWENMPHSQAKIKPVFLLLALSIFLSLSLNSLSKPPWPQITPPSPPPLFFPTAFLLSLQGQGRRFKEKATKNKERKRWKLWLTWCARSGIVSLCGYETIREGA